MEGDPLIEDEEAQQGSYWHLFTTTFFAAVGGFLFGYDTGVISGALLFINEQFSLTSFQQEMVVSTALIGAIVGSIIGGPASDTWGRKPTIIFASFLFAGGSIMLGLSQNYTELLIGRAIVGLGIGVAANIVPIFVAEISPARYRGALVTVNVLCITSGQFISYLVDSGFAAWADKRVGWRWMLGLAAVPAVIQLLGMIFLVTESPRWLVSKHRKDEAHKILKKLRGGADISDEIEEIELSLNDEAGSWKDLFQPSIRPALLLGIALQASQQFCGINTAMYYSPKIVQMAGFTKPSEAIFFADAVALTNALFTVASVYLIDRIGRRKLLFFSICGLVVGLTLLGFSFKFAEHLGQYSGYISVASLALYTAFFAIGMGPVPWAVNAEIYPTSVRGIANGVATTVNWTANLIVSISFLSYIELVHEAFAFWTYAIIGVLSLILFYFILPETKGKTIEEIQQHFGGPSVRSINSMRTLENSH